MDYFIRSGGAENEYMHFLEQPTLENTDDAEAEWQIPTLTKVPKRTQGFRNRDFRNPQTGESIIPTEVYVQLQREVHRASGHYRWNMIILLMVVQVTALLIPIVVVVEFDDVDSSSSIYSQIACFAGFVLLGCLVWRSGMQWMNKSLNARMERLVQERQGTFMEYGVKLGYVHETTWCYWNRAHVWLRRIPESQPSGTQHITTANSSLLESTRDVQQEQQLFPSIFIHWLLPGDIHINEKEYDPSMVMDQDVWTMIQEAYIGTFKASNRYMAILMHVLGIVLMFYSFCISYFFNLIGDLEAWLVWQGIMTAFLLTWFIMDRLNVKAWSKVADDVTSRLLNNENPHLNGIVLKFETSPLPFRSRHLSRRFQFVRIQENTNPLHSSAIDGTIEDHDDVYHIL